jgi:anthranilate phosphoribosyltransferase
VHGKNGLDAISPEGETTVWDLKDGEITTRTISPSLFGIQENPLSAIQLPSNGDSDSSSPAAYYSVHAKIIASLFSPRRLRNKEPITTPYQADAYGTTRNLDTSALEDWVCMNAAALLLISGKAPDEKAAFALASKTLKEGKAYHALEALRDAAALAVDVDSTETPQAEY